MKAVAPSDGSLSTPAPCAAVRNAAGSICGRRFPKCDNLQDSSACCKAVSKQQAAGRGCLAPRRAIQTTAMHQTLERSRPAQGALIACTRTQRARHGQGHGCPRAKDGAADGSLLASARCVWPQQAHRGDRADGDPAVRRRCSLRGDAGPRVRGAPSRSARDVCCPGALQLRVIPKACGAHGRREGDPVLALGERSTRWPSVCKRA